MSRHDNTLMLALDAIDVLREPILHGPAVVMISLEDLAGLEETISVLSDTDVVRALQAAEKAVADGDVVRGVDAGRALRPPTAR